MQETINKADLTCNVLSRLNKIQELPKRGLVCGGAVAAAIFEELGLTWVNKVYNDIDIFDSFSDEEVGEKLTDFAQKDPSEQMSLDVPEITKGPYGEVFMPGEAYSYHINFSKRIGMINLVGIMTWADRTQNGIFEWIEVLESFDFNYVQCGINLETGELLTTKSFWKFIQTRQLEIVNLRSPMHSAIRWFKKVNELGDGVYSNVERTMGMLGQALALIYTSTLSIPTSARFFGEETFERFLQYRSQVEEYFICYKEKVALDAHQIYSFTPKDMGDHITDMFSLGNRFHNLKMIETPLPSFHTLFLVNEFGSRAEKERIATLFNLSQCGEGSGVVESPGERALPSFVRNNLKCFVGQKKMNEGSLRSFFSVLKQHSLSALAVNHSFDEMEEIFSNLRALKKKHGDLVYGFLEGNRRFLKKFDLPAFIKSLEEYLREGDEELVTKSFPPKEISGFKIDELITKNSLRREGTYMHHCVGGYGDSVGRGSCKIVTLKSANRKLNLTAELTPVFSLYSGEPVTKATFKIAQIKHKSNKNPSPEMVEAFVDALTSGYGVNIVESDFSRFQPIPVDEDEEILF